MKSDMKNNINSDRQHIDNSFKNSVENSVYDKNKFLNLDSDIILNKKKVDEQRINFALPEMIHKRLKMASLHLNIKFNDILCNAAINELSKIEKAYPELKALFDKKVDVEYEVNDNYMI